MVGRLRLAWTGSGRFELDEAGRGWMGYSRAGQIVLAVVVGPPARQKTLEKKRKKKKKKEEKKKGDLKKGDVSDACGCVWCHRAL